jgi:hypothetical protein
LEFVKTVFCQVCECASDACNLSDSVARSSDIGRSCQLERGTAQFCASVSDKGVKKKKNCAFLLKKRFVFAGARTATYRSIVARTSIHSGSASQSITCSSHQGEKDKRRKKTNLTVFQIRKRWI